jgi:glycosyltransferase involved in cell wall biosynthesis
VNKNGARKPAEPRRYSGPAAEPGRNVAVALTAVPETEAHSTGKVAERRVDRHAARPPRITVFTRGYPPAYMVGGPARSLSALVQALAADFRFSIITSAFDGRTAEPMHSVKPSQWSSLGPAMIWYERRYRIPAWRTVTLLKTTKPQLVYLNSFFDFRFAILPLVITRMISRRTPVALAPRGELSTGALAFKWQKKRLFIIAFRMFGLHKVVTWHASTTQEKADIERLFGSGARSSVAVNLRSDLSVDSEYLSCEDRPKASKDYISLVFFSRIVPKKNVAMVIKAMALVEGKVRLSVAGPIEDEKYWAQCLKLIDHIGDPEMVSYGGVIPPDEVVSFLGDFDLFVLPTHGENFGHAVLESLAAGTPVIVGRDVPWRQIETAGAGWMCDPSSAEEIAALIRQFVDLGEEERIRMRAAARRVASQILNDPNSIDANRSMFRALISGGLV